MANFRNTLASRGEVVNLKPEYRLALARDGYALVTCELAGAALIANNPDPLPVNQWYRL